MTDVVWVTHPRHLPPPPPGNVVVVDVAFAAGNQFKSKTRPFIEALGDRLVRWIDHHEHPKAWRELADDPRFLLVKNQIAHACPELITPAIVDEALAERGPIAHICAHCDFDGAISAVKWLLHGREPWPGADEDARAVDSPGRGHKLSARGARLAGAMDEVAATRPRAERVRFMTTLVDALVAGEESLGLADEIDTLAARAEAAWNAARVQARTGREEQPGVFVVRLETPVDNRTRRNLLLEAETFGRVGAIFEPDKEGGHWLTAATFDPAVDLARVKGFSGGRSDYRFTRAHGDGAAEIAALSAYLRELPSS